VAEAVADEQVLARGLVTDAVAPDGTPFRQAAPTWAGTDAPDGPYAIRDGAVTDTADLLADAGLAPDEIDRMLEGGAIA
jgi:crotonobetainyl-CoA:carnitine CoA-transferase CaiB-like acyl-CoA transferase